jgi:magnesium chelatase family protein
MLAMRMPGILPPMTERESTEAASIASVSTSGFDIRRWGLRPFRSPHHTSSGVALVGGGSPPRPGEISLAHHGVLFLDELTEFSRSVLDVLREPMETGSIMISRANWQSEFPARFQIVAAMNPCPCGYLGDEEVLCRCSPEQITRYQSKISGPFLDRIDLTVSVPRIKRSQLRSFAASGESSESVRQRVIKARECQLNRQGASNAELQPTALDKHCRLSEADSELLERSSERLQLSLRSHVRVIKIARTIADLAGVDDIAREHLLEALSYRTQMLAVRQ